MAATESPQPNSSDRKKKVHPLPPWARFYFYGMHGLLDEIVFTALFDFFLEPAGNRKLQGCTTIVSFFIYGSCSFCVEQIYTYSQRNGYSLAFRLPLYVVAVYMWELSWGVVLTQLDLCSWDYSHYPLNLMGLITLVYAPGWVVLCLLQDFIYRYLFSLHIVDPEHRIKSA